MILFQTYLFQSEIISKKTTKNLINNNLISIIVSPIPLKKQEFQKLSLILKIESQNKSKTK